MSQSSVPAGGSVFFTRVIGRSLLRFIITPWLFSPLSQLWPKRLGWFGPNAHEIDGIWVENKGDRSQFTDDMASRSFLSKVLKGAEWSQVRDYLSPAILDVLSPADFRRQAVALGRPFIQRSYWKQGRDQILQALPEDFLEDEGLAASGSSQASNRVRAQKVLELYFYQIENFDSAILDLRSQSFSTNGEGLEWNPSSLLIHWEPEFIQGLRQIYRGFYGTHHEAFAAGLRSLNLLDAEDIFTKHFGEGNQTEVRFELTHFHDTFHQTFIRCKDHSVQLHRNFLGLGLMLASLYEHLEEMNVPCDVRAAYAKVT